MTYPNDGNFLHVVFESLRLLVGILLGHDVDWMVAETLECTIILLGESGFAWPKTEIGMDIKNFKSRSELVGSILSPKTFCQRR